MHQQRIQLQLHTIQMTTNKLRFNFCYRRIFFLKEHEQEKNCQLLSTNQLLKQYQQSSSQLFDDTNVVSQTTSNKQQNIPNVETNELWNRYYHA